MELICDLNKEIDREDLAEIERELYNFITEGKKERKEKM